MITQAHRLVKQTFGAKIATSETLRFHMYRIKKKMFFEIPLSFILTVEHLKTNIFLILNLHAQSELSLAVGNKRGMQDFTK